MTEDIEMKQGLVYQGDRTNQLRYADKDGKEQWIQQNSRYKALETIKRGQAVSIATKKDFERFQAQEELNSTDTYIVLTDTRIHNRCIGLAEQPANKGEEIHIQSFGKFEYNTDYEKLHNGLEYNPSFDFSQVGKTVYIAYPGPKFEGDSDLGAGILTTDKDKVYKYYHNIIQVGHLTDAPVKGTNQKITSIEVSIQGDDRGLLEATQHEGVMAEDVEFNPLNPIRVFAFGQDPNEKFIYTFKYSPLNDKNHVFTKDDFIFVHKLGGEGAFVSFTDDFNPNKVINDQDFAETHYPFIFEKERQVFKVNLLGDDFANTDSLDKNIQSIAKAFQKAYKSTTGEDTEIKCTNTSQVETHIQQTSDVDYRIDERVATIKSLNYVDFVDVYISRSLRERLSESKVVQHGSTDNRGKIVLADIRLPSRRNIFGVYYGNEPKLLKGRTYPFIRQGEIVVPKSNQFEFKLGTDYYLDRFGMLESRPLLKHGVVAKIATVKQDRRLVIHDTGTQRMFRGDLPVAYQKPCAAELDENGNLHYISSFGYVACDGNQKLKISEYEVLYKTLLGWYPQSEIEDDGVYFRIPRIVRETAFDYTDTNGDVVQKMVEVPVEMKCEPDSIFEELNHTVYLRDFQRFEQEKENEDVRASIQPFEISAIASYGFKDEQYIGLENFDIHLYVDADENYQGGPHNWQEVSEGFFSFNEANTYGFKWKLEYTHPDPIKAPYGKWFLSSDIGDGHGIALVNGDNSCPLKVTNCYYKLYVARKEKAPRQFDIENVYKRYQTNTIYSDDAETKPFLNRAATGKAVQLAIRNQHDVDSIIVNEGAVLQYGTKEVKIKSLEVGSEGTVKIYADDDVMFETTISEIGVNEIRKFIDDYWKEHHFTRTIDGKDWEKEYSEAEDDKGRIHGIITGKGGNVNASAVEHIQVAKLSDVPVTESENEDDYEEHSPESFKSSWLLKEENGYIPLRAPDENGTITELHEGKDKYYENGQFVSSEFSNKYNDIIIHTKVLGVSDTETGSGRAYVEKVSTPGGDKTIEVRYNFDLADEENQDKQTDGECTDIDFVKTANGNESFARIKIGSFTVASLSKLKRIYGEKLPHRVKYTTPLAENSIKYDEDTNYFKSVLGSALQAAYEMPISYWQYNNEKEWYNKTLSVVVERIKDTINNFDDSVYKDLYNDHYNYTEAQRESIKEYLKSTLDTAEKGVNQTSQVGLLLEAAKETQERLLKLETSTFGADAETIPGNWKPYINTGVEGVNSDPTTLGLNRLVRAICLELYHDVNPDNPTGGDFIESPRQPFTDDNSRTSSLSRVDELDRLLHGRVEGTEDGTKAAINYLRNINSASYPYHIEELPTRDKNTVKKTLVPVVSRETMFGAKPLQTNQYNFNGVIDALFRITQKVNALTTCVVGEDNILAGPIELNKIRDRISERETYDLEPLLDFSWEDSSDRMFNVVPFDEDN